jgi:aminoglycoside phosphotransferase (APT) family kinase protein
MSLNLNYRTPGGPFPSIKAFNNWFSLLPQSRLPDSQKFQDPYRHLLPDNGVITLTHADLHRGNTTASSTAPPRVVAIIDWGQSG